MTYKKLAKAFLEENNISVGDKVLIKKEDISYEGTLIDRYADSDDGYLVLKLDSGYNIGISIDDISIELIENGEKSEISYKGEKLKIDPKKETISILSTGGTVSSIIDYNSGAVHPAFEAEELLKSNPELFDYSNYNLKALFNILSENLNQKYWVKISKAIADEISNESYGVVIAHGTDTLHYTAAALSFMIRSPVPIIISGAQKSVDRPSTDAHLNLINSVIAAKSDLAEVSVCMHSDLNDISCDLHSGVKVRKMHTTRRDTFRSINFEPIAKIKNNEININPNYNYIKRNERELELFNNIEEKVGLIKTFPGISKEFIEYHIDKGYKGLVIEGSGLGHVPENLIDTFIRAKEEEIPIVMASQCLYGRVNMNVYSTGRKLLDAGVISCEDMTPETSFVKLSWSLGQSNDYKEVKEIFSKNIAGEINDKTSVKYFLN